MPALSATGFSWRQFMVKIIHSNPDVQRKSERHKVFSTKPFSEVKTDLEDLDAQGKFRITFSGNLADLAQKPFEQLDAVERDMVMWFKNCPKK